VRVGAVANERVKWWRQARFGMFIHFGIYAVPCRGEWVMYNESIPHREYAQFAEQFTPDPDAPKRWVSLAKEAGMKYVVLTARHHDGFSLFDSHANAFNSVKTAAHTDIVRTFTDAARDEGLRVGLYYSPLDWRFPGYFMPDLYLESAEAMREQYHKEMEQLASKYGHLDLIWYDGGGENWLGFGGLERGDGGWKTRDGKTPYRGKFSWQDDQVNARLRELQPSILFNDRTATMGDWRTREGAGALGDFDNVQPWELCLTLAGPWGYQPNATPQSLDSLVRLLTNTVSRDGNMLLNVGPDPAGNIPADQVARLQELGNWLKLYGRAIYDTRGGPFLPTASLTSTRRGNTAFVHLLANEAGECPERVTLPALSQGLILRSARLLATNTDVVWRAAANGDIELTIPSTLPSSPTQVIELTYSDSIMAVDPLALARGASQMKPTDATVAVGGHHGTGISEVQAGFLLDSPDYRHAVDGPNDHAGRQEHIWPSTDPRPCGGSQHRRIRRRLLLLRNH
jgi:alpha-L-fucosidase